jgi:hypothetical protein
MTGPHAEARDGGERLGLYPEILVLVAETALRIEAEKTAF